MIAGSQKQPEGQEPIILENFPGGLNTSVPAEMIAQDELAECVNWKYNYAGQLVTRDPVTKYTTAPTSGGIASIGYAKIDGDYHTLVGDGNNNIYYFPLKYESDFSAGVDGWANKDGGSIDGNIDSIGGENDWFRKTNSATASTGALKGGFSFTQCVFTAKIFIPSTNTKCDGVRVYVRTSDFGVPSIASYPFTPVADTVTEITFTHSSTTVVTVLYVLAANGELVTDNAAGDLFYIKDIEIEQTVGATPTLIGQVSGEPRFLGYNNVCLIFDGSYIKYLDDVSSVKMAYDDGETLFDNYVGATSGAGVINSSGIGCTFTTPAWDTGFTMPVTTVTAKVAETTAGSGTITASIWDVAGSAQVAVTTYTGALTGTMDYIEIAFASTDITTELGPEKEYYCYLKGSNVELAYTTVSTGGAYVTSAGVDSTKNPVMMINPGLPPKAAYGTISKKRFFTWGNPDKKGTTGYGKLTHLEYGSITAVDNDNNSFEIGGMVDLYGDLWVFGAEDHPYQAVLTGATESAWEIQLRFQEAWALPKTIRNIGNDVFTANTDGVDSLSGIQEYGDVRMSSESHRIKDIFRKYGVSTAFSGYYPRDGQYWIHLPGYSRTLVCHTKHPKRPWVEYLLPATPTAFKQAGEEYLIGSSDKYVYRIDIDAYKDLDTTQISPTLRTSYITFPFSEINLNKFQFMARSKTGGTFNLSVYINGEESTPTLDENFSLSVSNLLTVDEMNMSVDDMMFVLNNQESPAFRWININCWSVQFGIDTVVILGQPINFNGIFLKYTRLEE